MKPENAIEVRDVRKYFKVYMDKGHMLRERIIHFNRNRYERREVLKGISFDVKKGESVGLIGRNGCGKSTTLKLLTKILRPNGGTIDIQGRVCSLIELGAGFHPDMSGRENIYINASIFGIKAKEVEKRMNDIIRFSELEEFIDNPVRTYSSGMYMRLAFSVAINVDADILLIDEILAVGDNSFQTKCFNKLKSLKEQGTTIVIVSHALGQVEKLCDRAIWIDKGKIRKEGSARKICREYLDCMESDRLERAELEYRMQLEEEEKKEKDKQAQVENERKYQEAQKRNASCREIAEQCGPDARREGDGKVVFTKVEVLNKEKKQSLTFETDEMMEISMEYKSNVPKEKANFVIGITRDDWVYCYGTTVRNITDEYIILKPEGKVSFLIPNLKLLEGKYYIDLRIQGQQDELFDCVYSLFEIHIKEQDIKKELGILRMDCKWNWD